MSDRSSIEWTDASWNPIRARNKATGKAGHYCAKVSAGCKNCYAERMQKRFGNPIRYGLQDLDKVELYLDEKVLLQPLKWKKPRMVFVCSMTDLFGEWVPQEWMDKIWAVMALCPQHTFQVLTKRPEGMARYLQDVKARHDEAREDKVYNKRCSAVDVVTASLIGTGDVSTGACVTASMNVAWPLPNVWLGTSVENQATADVRIPHLLKCPAVVRWLSVEPMLGAVDAMLDRQMMMDWHQPDKSYAIKVAEHIHWVVCGGESGPKARPMHPEWARSLRDQCKAAGVAFFFKQMSKKASIPEDLFIREWPHAR